MYLVPRTSSAWSRTVDSIAVRLAAAGTTADVVKESG